jgi:beta-lactamase superfamily II metal-dependent hydrolase
MKNIIKVFPVNCGDAIRIIQKDPEGKVVGNILIDSGYIGTYPILKEGIKDLLKKGGKIDLWILSHLDADHINGALEFLRDPQILNKGKIIKRFWFNCFDPFKIPTPSKYVSLGNGIKLRKLLKLEKIKKVNPKVVSSVKRIKINNAFLTILSPDINTYNELHDNWKKEEKKYKKADDEGTFAGDTSLDKKKIKQLSSLKDKTEPKSGDLANRSSIAFLYESNKQKALFLGDAMPSQIISSLKGLGFSKKKKLKVKYVKLSHHGSRANYSNSLLEYIECNEFIISADGGNANGIPDKEVLAKIILHPARNFKNKIKFHFNYADDRFKKMFKVDAAEKANYNFETVWPKPGKELTLKF